MPSERAVAQPLPFSHRLLYWLACSALALVGIMARLVRPSIAACGRTRLCIESGVLGWQLIEYKELHASACEYLGADHVIRVTVESRPQYLHHVRRALSGHSPTHYFYDPRTGSQQSTGALWQAFTLAVLFRWRGIVPIAWLTDLPIRRMRLQCALVTAVSGITLTLMSPMRQRRMFPHRRLIGPSLMPFSSATLGSLTAAQRNAQRRTPPRAIFSGSLYEPRTTILNGIRDGLRLRGLDLEILARTAGGQRVSDEEYWARQLQADILVTTSEQVTGPGIDDVGLPHFIFRYTEALAAGILLVAPDAPGINRFFTAGEHFAAFDSIDGAVDLIAYYLEHGDERRRLAARGAERLRHLVGARAYWTIVDAALATEGFA